MRYLAPVDPGAPSRLVLHLPARLPAAHAEESLLSGPPEPTNRPYAIAKIAGIELCWAYNRQHGTRYLAVMPTNLYGPGDHYDLETSRSGGSGSRAGRGPVAARAPVHRAPAWSSSRTLRLRERSARIRHSSKVRWGISWAGLAIEAKDTLYSLCGPWRSYGGAIRASLCGLAYRRLSFGPVACKLGARIKGNLYVELCCPFHGHRTDRRAAWIQWNRRRIAGMAQVLFWSFFALFLVSLVMGWRQRPLQ